MRSLIRLLMIIGASLMLAGVSYAYDCSSAAQYVDGSSYSTGAVVQNNGHAYQCTVAGWCTVGGPYAPGTGWAWTHAWSDLGACDSGNPPPSSGGNNPPPSSGGNNPPPSSGGNNPPPSSGGNNPPPSSGGNNPPPSSGGNNPPPSSGNTIPGFVLSPYKDISIWSGANLSEITTKVDGHRKNVLDTLPKGLTAMTLAFATGNCGSEAWPGGYTDAKLQSALAEFDSRGVSYILSGGGAKGVFLCGSSSALSNFIQRYYTPHMIGVDFDLESSVSQAQAEQLASAVKGALQQYPDMRFSFTLATFGSSTRTQSSLGAVGQTVMAAIAAQGLTGEYINLMTMDYGKTQPQYCVIVDGACDMGQSAIAAAKSLHDDYGIPYDHIEITPMIGRNDSRDEIFTLADADELSAFAKNVGLGGIHYWSYDRDNDCDRQVTSATCNAYPNGQGNFAYAARFVFDLYGISQPPPGSTTVNCDNAQQYVKGDSYDFGSIVLNDGGLYQCKVAGWCSGDNDSYVPGSGSAWQSAWEKIDTCSGGNPPPSSGGNNPPPSSGGNNPPPSSGGNNPPPSSGGNNPPPSSGGNNPPPSSGGNCGTVAAWNASTAYNGGAEVSYDGILYTANWWTQGDNPATHSGQWDVWTSQGACPSAG